MQGGSQGDGAPIIQWTLSGDNQVWTMQPSGSHFELINRNSNKCITTDGVAGHQVYQWYCSGTDNQLWDTSLTAGNLTGYRIKSVASGLALDVAGSSGARGAAIDTWYWNATPNQYFLASAA
ncbi:RICIN domain-containing protein [Paractinoplanes globisporus]|uniref:RICIN domain-containing protein n=1 Tax=Paractinoplanes globisporus TaxID=113565 RepID=A0ABW6W8Z0_9ACTN|nr:RICIN domain-containing protein [Actinoplanes globisporus]